MIPELTKAAIALPLTIALFLPSTFAQEAPKRPDDDQKFTYGAETDFNTAYVWRGIVIDDKPVMQPSAWISASGLTLIAWSSLALTNAPGSARLHAADLILTYRRNWKKLRIEPAMEAYLSRRSEEIDARNTMEGSLKLSYPAGPLRLFTIHAFDILAYKGSYFGEAGLGYEGHLTKRTELAFYIRSGWASSEFNDAYIGLDKPAFNFVGVEGSLTYYLRPYLYFRPHFEFSSVADRGLREYLSSPTIVNCGLAMGFDF